MGRQLCTASSDFILAVADQVTKYLLKSRVASLLMPQVPKATIHVSRLYQLWFGLAVITGHQNIFF